MKDIHVSDTVTRIKLRNKEVVLIGTAHVSSESADEVERVIREEKPDHVCIEIDEGRFAAMKKKQSWESMNIGQVMKQGKAFLLLVNLVLTSFQRRMGMDLGIAPGEEMKRAVSVCEEEDISFSFADREIQTTLRRAWAKSGFWGKNKLVAALLSSAFTNEKLSEEEIERLKEKSALEDMMQELAGYLPSVKEVLIDERDRFLATKIFQAPGERNVAVIGAGHGPGIIRILHELDEENGNTDLSDISSVPPRGRISRVLPWLVPAVILVIVGLGFVSSGWQNALSMLWMWVLVNGTLSALGAIIALAHPLTIILSFVAAPITSLNPTIGVGIVAGLIEGVLRKPRVKDFETLHDDILSIRGFYRNRFTHALLVFFLSSVGSAVGTFIGIPYLTSLIGG
ncbi:conjugal transfer protein TraB [Marispirochaeta aestuarii]|uniref:Conjugal transfer protein TraB n=1 Tax=Marispirochaeta aestuarii TaxID=1963862 RepID=A0A1Y1S0S4_9SPIO|nr:TraB/GumN family protein [Marispirochaeta aestuarii]ORC36934.1 conjugal transfer protein TraB [Marispirochaeta aestuarii]